MLDIMSKARKESTAKPEESKSKETNNSPKKGKRKRSLSDPFMDVDSQQPSGSQGIFVFINRAKGLPIEMIWFSWNSILVVLLTLMK